MKNYLLLGILLAFTSQLFAQKTNNLSSYHFEQVLETEAISLSAKEDYIITASHVSSTSQTLHSYYIQRYDEIGVYDAIASSHILHNGNLLTSHVDFVRELSSKILSVDQDLISPQEAIAFLATEFDLNLTEDLQILAAPQSRDRDQKWSDGGISKNPIPLKLMYQKTENGNYALCWDMVIQLKETGFMWNIRIDASTGETLDKTSWTISCNILHDHDHDESCNHDKDKVEKQNSRDTKSVKSTASMVGAYNVYAMPLESPDFGARTLVSDPEDLIASPFGWHDTDGVTGPEHTVTKGNNCDAYEDGDNSGFQPDGNGALNFDFPINTVYSSGDQSESAILTNLFYWNNLCHDVWYKYGFDEASGNFQENNYGNGGASGDSVNAEAQDGSGTCNANMSTPTDGGNGTMQMYICGSRDGDLDNGVIVHEYGHGISIRLTGGGGNSSCLNNTEQMGEGWSDYFGLMMTLENGDTGTDARPIGNWLLGNGPNGAGIRAHPYSTDLGVNPHTYDDIKTAAVPHGVGSVWCMMLWEMSWALIDLEGFDTDFYNGTGGNNIAMSLVIEGLKLQPCSPGFIDGRDAILAADVSLYGGQYSCLIWEAFAKRGLGVNADQASSSSKTDGTEDFTAPVECLEPTIGFITTTLNISEDDAQVSPTQMNDCRDYTDFIIELGLSIDATGPVDVALTDSGTADNPRDYEIIGGPFSFPSADTLSFTLRIFDDGSVESTEDISLALSITNGGSNDAILGGKSTFAVSIEDNDFAPGAPAPADLSFVDFEVNLDGFTTVNPNGGDAFALGTESDASSSSWTVPSNGSTNLVYANDDDCNCDMSNVSLFTPIYDLTFWTSAVLDFNLFFEGRTYQSITETAELLVSTDSGTTFTSLQTLAGETGNWRIESIDISAYDGMDNIQFSINYNDGGGWLYGIAADDFKVSGGFSYSPNIASSLNDSDTKYVGPNAEVYFYNGMEELIAGISNAAHDFGCITVTTDRDGDGTTEFWDAIAMNELADKSQLITAANNDGAASYDLTLFYTGAEVSGWETNTGNTWETDAKIIKHPTTISDVTPATPAPNGPGSIEQEITTAGENLFSIPSHYITASFSTGFSGLGVGNPGAGPIGCETDVTAPVVTTQDILVSLDATGNIMILPAQVDDGSTDECGIDDMFLDTNSFSCVDIGPNVITLFVSDISGNSASSTATVTIEDAISPTVITKDHIATLDATGNVSIDETDIDDGTSDACGLDNTSLDITAFTCSEVGTNIVVLTATDSNGNSASSTATVTIEDTTVPTVLTKDHIATLDATGNVSIDETDIDDGTNDACGLDNISLDITDFTCSEVGTNIVILTATDSNGNSASSTATVTIVDDIFPVVITKDFVVALDDSGSVTILSSDIDDGSSDICGIASYSLDKESFDCNDVGNQMVILTVTDNSFNSSTGTATVTVTEDIGPLVITKNVTIELDVGATATIVPADVDDDSSAICGIASYELDNNSFDCSLLGPQVVILTVTDNNGSTETGMATVTIIDPNYYCCYSGLELNDNPIENHSYNSSDFINSTGVIPAIGEVYYNANEINLGPGFETNLGALFEALINPCSN